MARQAGGAIGMAALAARQGAPGFFCVPAAPFGGGKSPARVAVLTLVQNETIVVRDVITGNELLPTHLMGYEIPGREPVPVALVAVHARLLRMAGVALLNIFADSLQGVHDAETGRVG